MKGMSIRFTVGFARRASRRFPISRQSSISAAKARIEEKAYDREISFDDQTIKQFLATAHRVAADADGKFKVILSTGKEYWVLADGDVPPFRQWYFRYFPDGMPLILSDGNSN
jgi:hypothetical protein